MHQEQFERMEIYPPPPQESEHLRVFKAEFGNENFKISKATYVALGLITLFAAQGLVGDQSDLLNNMNEGLRLLTYFSTMLIQWIMFALIYFALYREGTFLKGAGFEKLKTLDFSWGLALLLSLFAIGTGAGWFFTQIGMPPKGEIAMLLPQELTGKIVWVFLSFTAGFCEEAIFRGYLMTRVRMLGKFKSWTVPVIVSAFMFGFPHLYQGTGNFLIITVLGVLFSLVYIKTKSIWPCVIAHFFLDFLNLFIPQ